MSLFDSVDECKLIKMCMHVCTCICTFVYMKKNISGGARQAKRSLDSTVLSLLAGNTHNLSSTPPVYIRKVHMYMYMYIVQCNTLYMYMFFSLT